MPVAVVQTSGSASTSAADGDRSGLARQTTARLESVIRPAAAPDPGDGRGDLEDVAGPDGGAELHVVVGGEQPLVAVGADAQLGGHVAEQAEHVGAVDQVARRSGRAQ